MKKYDEFEILRYIELDIEKIMYMNINQADSDRKRRSIYTESSSARLADEYEDIIKEYEKEIRTHIKLENQLKIKLEEYMFELENSRQEKETINKVILCFYHRN